MRTGLLVLASAVVLGAAQASAGDASAPMDLRPPMVAPKALKKPATRVMVPPLPRLRPAIPPLAAELPPAPSLPDSSPPAEPPAAVAAVPSKPSAPSDVSLEHTGTIAAEPETPPPAPIIPEPEERPVPAPVVAANPVMPDPAITDDLPGDPSGSFALRKSAEIDLTSVPPLEGEPYELVRTLQMLQDQIAQGSTKALLAERGLRTRIDQQFARAPARVWQDPRNAAAAVTYVLSGGAPAILARLGTLDPPPAVDGKLVRGVLAYVEGKEAEANELLAGFDPFDQPLSMGAQLALAQSALAVRNDPAKAMALLDVARLLATGTLVEEAALRRELFVADQMNQPAKVEMLARQYLARFRHSVYAGNFRNRFAAAVTHMDFVKDAKQFSRLDDMLSAVEPPARCQLYLTVALAAVVKGDVVAAKLAAERAAALADSGSAEKARADLYRAAALVADAKAFDNANGTLGAVNIDLLSPSDHDLYDMVEATIDGVKTGTDMPAKKDQQIAQLDAAQADAPTPLMKRADDTIAAVDALLAKAPK